MAAVSLFWNTNTAAVTSCENALHEILRTISQSRTLSASIPAIQKGVYLFYNPPINFQIVPKPLAKSRCCLTTIGRDCWERVDLIGLTIFPLWLDQNLTGCDVNLTFAVPQNTWRFLTLAFWFVFYCLLCNFWNNISDRFSANVTIARLYKKGRFSTMYDNKDENKTLVQTFSVEIRGGGQVSTQTGVIAW